jgi:hypothetical protein
LFDDTRQKGAKVNCSDVNEDLGQVEYLFVSKQCVADRTLLRMKAAYVGEKVYGSVEEH